MSESTWHRARWLIPLGLGVAVNALAGDGRSWTPLNKDLLHDPDGPAFHELQEPGAALSALPPDVVGNQVRWVQALEKGIINPRAALYPGTQVNVLDMDIIFTKTGDNWFVRFPHKQHTEWLDCNNCHEKIFKKKFGETQFKMMDILQGKFCGQCHGAVAFPLTECQRCHSIEPKTFTGKPGPQVKVTEAK